MKVEIPVFPNLPERISRLGEFSYNLWWSWQVEARELYRSLDRTLWRNTRHNPIQLLRQIQPSVLDDRARDPNFLSLYDRVMGRYDNYLSGTNPPERDLDPEFKNCSIAYFCAEFGIHSSLPIYSGGLGLLAGDTCKEASDLGLQFVAVGSLYPEGYFHQRIGADGTQEAHYVRLDISLSPILPVLNNDGTRLIVSIPVGSREVRVAVWMVQVGRVEIYLMDTDIPENDPWDRDLSARLYGGDQHVRLRQEIVLGMGGVRVLRAIGYEPDIFHLNEGHAAFASLELIREHILRGLNFHESLEKVRERLVFTTHTPVKAGHDEFPYFMMEEFFGGYWESLRLNREDFLGLGAGPDGHSFSMTVLALKTSARANGVSRTHGEISRHMWNFLWPDRPAQQVPIASITNGVHVPTWVAPEMEALFQRHLGADWLSRHDDPAVWERIREIPNEILWRTHDLLKLRLLSFIRERARKRWMEGELSPGQLVGLGSLLSPHALTIGFARRFATYKRATLLFSDLERLKRILHNPWRPVQVIFAGKAHPADEPGMRFLQHVFQFCSSHEMGGHIALIEDYDKHVAHHMVHGVDLWLNNPIPPKEASGTSGQKASLNGIPNFSVLDGWWVEGYNGSNGWAIPGENDGETADTLYRLLEDEIVPCYFERDASGLPHRWIEIMKESIRSTTAPFSARRMLKNYAGQLYSQALTRDLKETANREA